MALKKQQVTVLSLFLLAGGVAISLIFSLGIFAQNQSSVQSLELSPPSQELVVDPGQTIVAKAKIRNKGRESVSLLVRIEDFMSSGEEGQIALIEQGPYSLAQWTVLTPTSLVLTPGEEKEVTATIKVPRNKVAGGYYGSFVFSVKNTNPNQIGTASIGQEIASLFLLKITGAVDEQILLDSLVAPRFSEFGPIPFTLKFTNTGNVHTKVYGLVNISDMFGQRVADLVINQTNVFPGASRLIKTNLEKKLLFGTYTATAIMYYGTTKNETLTAVNTFIVIPYRIIALVIFGAIIIYSLRKRIKKAVTVLMK